MIMPPALLLLAASVQGASLWITPAQESGPRLAPGELGACAGPADAVLRVSPGETLQPIDGFGAAMTESSVIVLERLPPVLRESALKELFSPEGLGLSMLRVPVGATDFSAGDYSCDDPPVEETADPALRHFSLERCAGKLIPYLKKAKALNPRIKLIASPWSAPAWMKTGGSMRGGSLKPEWQEAYAGYLTRFAVEMARAGLALDYLTVVNEPGYETGSYPTMLMPAERQAEFIGRYLGPALAAAKLGTRVLAWDHNWEEARHPDYALRVLRDPRARRWAAGSAWHCYGGSPESMGPVFREFPDKEIHFTECSAGGWETRFVPSFHFGVDQMLVGNLSHGARSVLWWNLALDENGGPTNNGCLNCRGLITTFRGGWETTPEYWALAHARRAVDPGAFRVASALEPAAAVPAVAVRNPDGSIGALLRSSSERPLALQVKAGARCASFSLPPGAAASVRLPRA